MPRRARIIFPGVPHHVTQRGNHREPVFFGRGDKAAYARLLGENAERFAIEIIAYCLMPNHVHLVVIPSTPESLHLALKAAHGHYAQRVNRMRSQAGHLWQGRYFSSPLDADYFLNAVRYVELNPVRARLVTKAEEYDWSSAAAHCGLRNDRLIHSKARPKLLAGIADWSQWLGGGLADDTLATLRRNGSQNLPCGSSEFVTQLERDSGRPLSFRPPGRQSSSPESSNGELLFQKGNVPFKGERPL